MDSTMEESLRDLATLLPALQTSVTSDKCLSSLFLKTSHDGGSTHASYHLCWCLITPGSLSNLYDHGHKEILATFLVEYRCERAWKSTERPWHDLLFLCSV